MHLFDLSISRGVFRNRLLYCVICVLIYYNLFFANMFFAYPN